MKAIWPQHADAGRWCQFHHPSRAICARIASARRSSGFTNGHVSWPQGADVIERIRKRTRT
jgi:hypothetical protein